MYSYRKERPKIFTEEGQLDFLKVRDEAKKLLKYSGAFKQDKLLNDLDLMTGDGWTIIAYVDRLVELNEIREITFNVAGQDRVFVGVKW